MVFVNELPSTQMNDSFPFDASSMVDGASAAQAQSWYETIYEDSLYLLSMINTFRADVPGEIIDMGLNSMDEIERRVHAIQSPESVSTVRWHLLNAIGDMKQAYNSIMVDKEQTAAAYNHAAKIEMGFFDIELLRVGLS